MDLCDNSATIYDIKKMVKEFCEERDWDQFHNPKDLAIAVMTEASELLEIFRFKSNEECEKIIQDEKKRQQIADELADVLYFIIRFSQKYNFDLSSEFERKMKINLQKYPIEKSKGSNKKYSEV